MVNFACILPTRKCSVEQSYIFKWRVSEDLYTLSASGFASCRLNERKRESNFELSHRQWHHYAAEIKILLEKLWNNLLFLDYHRLSLIFMKSCN